MKDIASKFGADYKGKYARYRQIINASKFPTTFLEDTATLPEVIDDLKATLDAVQLQDFDPAHKADFINEHFPQMVKLLLCQK